MSVDDSIDIDIESTNKTSYKSCKAIRRDTKDNVQKSTIVGSGEPIKIIKDSFELLSDTKIKAQACLEKANTGTKAGTISSDGFVLYAGAILNLFGTLKMMESMRLNLLIMS